MQLVKLIPKNVRGLTKTVLKCLKMDSYFWSQELGFDPTNQRRRHLGQHHCQIRFSTEGYRRFHGESSLEAWKPTPPTAGKTKWPSKWQFSIGVDPPFLDPKLFIWGPPTVSPPKTPRDGSCGLLLKPYQTLKFPYPMHYRPSGDLT